MQAGKNCNSVHLFSVINATMATVVSLEEYMLLRDDTNQQWVYIYKFKENCHLYIYIKLLAQKKLTYTLIISTKYKIELFHTENKCISKLNIQEINVFRTQTNNKFLHWKG